jgi:glycerate 2-kinase
MQILIAPNAFKNSLGAEEVAAAVNEGLQQSNLHCTTHCFPVGDGGDGTAELILKHFNGASIPIEVKDPLGRKITSSFGLMDDGKTAVIEMADASGLRLLKATEFDPLHATSYGTGELIKHALNNGIGKIILCIGGSATIDGGAGILQALGFRFLDKHKKELGCIPESLVESDTIDFSKVDERIMHCELIVLCDVENMLLGEQGAAAVFGPQKGASQDDRKKLEASLSKLRDVVLRQTGKDMSLIKHGGAAGGVAAGLSALLNAQLVNGIDYFLSLTGFDEALEKTDLVITGEGSIDLQTLQGKGPFGVAKRAKEKGIQVIGLAGKVPLETNGLLHQYFDQLLCINDEPMELSDALSHTRSNLIRTARALGDLLALQAMKQ